MEESEAMPLLCKKCGKSYEEGTIIPWRCSCGGYLHYDFMPVFRKEDIRKGLKSMWRYDVAYPLKWEDLFVTYHEGFTPLVDAGFEKCRLKLKMDNLMPTGSFKDRGTVMVINYLLKAGVSRITEDSSGNAGASVAGYCALGRIPCDIFVPKGNSRGKLMQIRAYGASIHEISGTREDVAAAAQRDEKSYAGHNWHPMFIQGTKSLAYELWEQNDFEAPEHIVTVAGNGSCVLGLYQGFQELLYNKMIARLPRLFVVQAQNCNPIFRMYQNEKEPASFLPTIAEGIALAEPNKCREVVDAVNDTGGTVVCVSEEEIVWAVKELASRGFYAEPTSAAAYAGLIRLLERQELSSKDPVIMMISGNGLKTGAEMETLFYGKDASDGT